jgi:hypothetical protein
MQDLTCLQQWVWRLLSLGHNAVQPTDSQAKLFLLPVSRCFLLGSHFDPEVNATFSYPTSVDFQQTAGYYISEDVIWISYNI